MPKKYIYYQYEHICYKSNIKNFSFENEWLAITPLGLIVVKGESERPYAWNGCSPKFYIGSAWVGTPEGVANPFTGHPLTRRASLFHDALYQFCHEWGGIVVTRKEVDKMFFDIMIQDGFKPAKLYYKVVRLFGWPWWIKNLIVNKKRNERKQQ
jgi:hypothetical protein